MAPKKRNIVKKQTNGKTSKKPKTEASEETNGEIDNSSIDGSNQESNGLRRSKRVSVIKPNKRVEIKSKYFSDSEEDNGSDDSLDNDEEFKPEVKAKPSIFAKPKKNIEVKKDSDSSSSSESDDGEDWEEVKDNDKEDNELDDYKPDIPTEGVEITLTDTVVNKKKKSCDINDMIRQRINRFKKENQANKHKTSLLVLISRAIYLNNVVNDQLIQAICLSLTISQFKAPKKLTIKFVNEFVDWFKDNFQLKASKQNDNQIPNVESLERCFHDKVATNSSQLNLAFLSLLRSLKNKFICRLCMALNPVDLKPDDLILSQKQSEIKNKPKSKSSKSKQTKSKSEPKKRKVVSSDSDSDFAEPESGSKCESKFYLEVWVEVYVESERKWISLDMSNKIVDKPMEIAAKSLPLLSYVIAIDFNGYIREVTQRYTDDWMSPAMKRRRTDHVWWTQTLEPFQRKNRNAAEKAEDVEFDKKISSTPLPTKISEYKNHPLYVLKKDLLKFQGIYPSDAPPLGFIRGEPVFARECVQLLRSRETWLRFARTVRIGESPYKLVKSRPKWDKYAKTWRKDLPLELFGEWQTEPYDPPEAKDGKVPRNGYGNIDLFQPCMLPKGCVHLQLPGLARVANKLKIDCVPAIVAFDNNNGGLGSHPVMDGYVVCKEFEEVLVAAWEEEQVNAEKRARERREKRVYDNWKKLIKGLLIREKVRKKYANKDEDSDETDIEDIEGDN